MKRILSLLLALLMLLSTVPTTAMATGEDASASATGTTVKLAVSISGYKPADTIAVKISSDKPLTLDEENSQWEISGSLSDISAVDEKHWNAIWGATAPADINRRVLTLSFRSEEAVSIEDCNFQYEVTVKNGSNVLKPEAGEGAKLEFPVEKVTLQETLTLDLSKQTEVQLEAVIEPSYTTDEIFWSSSDNTVVSVSDTGMLTLQGIGTAKITLTAGEKSATCDVSVQCAHQGDTEVRGEKAATCSKTGYTGDTYCLSCSQKIATGTAIAVTNHTGGTATCKDKAICATCKTAYGELEETNHAGGTEVRNAKAATCEEAGYTGDTYCLGCDQPIATGTAIAVTDHTGGIATCKDKAICTACKTPYGELAKTNHAGGTEVRDAKVATCGEAGYTGDTYCLGCNQPIATGTAIAVTNHTGGIATCKDKAICTVCKTAYGELAKTNHVGGTEVRDAKAATCEEAGYTGDTHCLGCNQQIATGSSIEATGHKMQETAAAVAPTCETAGKTAILTCANGCGKTEGGAAIAEKGHKMQETAAAVAPTCETAGKTAVLTCANGCGKAEGGAAIAEKGHDMGQWSVVKAATCTEDGLQRADCSRCEHFEEEVIPAPGHKRDEKHKCTVCGHIGGSCGANVLWELDEEAGKLTISGTGTMYQYSSGSEAPWWQWYREVIKTVQIETGVTSIGDQAFADCINLTTVTIADSVTNVGACAFKNCSGLTSLNIPASVTYIGKDILSGCSNIQELTIPFVGAYKNAEGKTKYTFGYLFGTSAFANAFPTGQDDPAGSPSWVNYFIPKSLTKVTVTGGVLHNGSFRNCTKLKQVVLGTEITEAGYSVFEGCTSLEQVTTPGGLRVVGDSMFSGCENLERIEIAEGVTQIGYNAFSNCSSLAVIALPETMTEIKMSAFSGCTSLETMTLSDAVTVIESGAFRGCTALKTVKLPSKLTELSNSLFYGCSKLKDVTIPSTVQSIQSGVFDYCTSLESIVIPEGITVLNPIFQHCTSLKSVTLPDTIYEIGSYAFLYCTALENIELPPYLYKLGEYAFNGCESLKSITFPENLIEIPRYSFGNCYNLSNVNFSKDTVKIRSSAFYACYSLRYIYIPASVTVIGDKAFDPDMSPNPFVWHVFYGGTESQWNSIAYESTDMPGVSGATGDTGLQQATIHYGVDGAKVTSHVNGCVADLTCTICNSTLRNNLGYDHDYNGAEWTVMAPAGCEYGGTEERRCKVCGAMESRMTEPLGHTGGTATCSASATCTRCWMTYGEVDPDNHAWDAGVITVQPTTEKDGVRTYTCSGCKTTKTESIPKVDHTHDYKAVVTAPTCTAQGYTTHTCACGDSYVDTYVQSIGHTGGKATCHDLAVCEWCNMPYGMLDSNNHAGTTVGDTEIRNAKDATCTEEGYTGDTYCLGCGKIMKTGSPTAVKNHSWNDGTITKPATHMEEGVKTYTCVNCPATKTEAVAKLTEHIWDDWADAGDGRNHTHECECGAKETAPHRWTDWAQQKAFTYARVCADCGAAQTMTIPEDKPVNATPETNAANTNLSNSDIELIEKIFTEEEQTQIVEGAEIKVYLKVDDITEAVPEEEKAEVENKVGENTIGMYLDINLFKQVNTEKEKQVAETAGAVSVVIEVPSHMINTDMEVIRTYQVVRVHRNEKDDLITDVIDGVFDHRDNTFTFETDKFSTYAFTYSDVKREVPLPTNANISLARMILGNELAMQFAFKAAPITEGPEDVDYVVSVTKTYADGRADKVIEVPQSQWQSTTSGGQAYYYVSFNGIAAKEMGDEIQVQIKTSDGIAVGEVFTDSVRAYAIRQLRKTTDAKTRTLYVDMLNYGAAAQTYFKYDASNLVTAELTATEQGYGTKNVALENNLVKGPGYSASQLNLASSIQLRVKFNGIDTSMYAIVKFTNHMGREIEARVEGTEFMSGTVVVVDEVVAADFKQDVTITVYDANGNAVASAVESVASYIARMSGGSEIYKAVAKYCAAAYGYLHK